jgi:hypothetical protein
MSLYHNFKLTQKIYITDQDETFCNFIETSVNNFCKSKYGLPAKFLNINGFQELSDIILKNKISAYELFEEIEKYFSKNYESLFVKLFHKQIMFQSDANIELWQMLENKKSGNYAISSVDDVVKILNLLHSLEGGKLHNKHFFYYEQEASEVEKFLDIEYVTDEVARFNPVGKPEKRYFELFVRYSVGKFYRKLNESKITDQEILLSMEYYKNTEKINFKLR